MRYRHRFRVAAPRAEVAAFHYRSASFKAIAPPLVPMRFEEPPPAQLGEGDTMRFTMWLGPIPVRWTARIEEVSEQGFVDRQLAGPFARWQHRHRFEVDGEDPNATWVLDEIEARLSDRPIQALVGLNMWAGLPVLFAYRGWKTRRLLARP
jgi:ligand-binding SRPBCC domain-containing protein